MAASLEVRLLLFRARALSFAHKSLAKVAVAGARTPLWWRIKGTRFSALAGEGVGMGRGGPAEDGGRGAADCAHYPGEGAFSVLFVGGSAPS